MVHKMEEKDITIKNLPLLRFVSTMALSKVNVDSRTKRLVLLRVQETTSSSSLSMNASASLPQVIIRHSRHLNVTIKAKSVAINCDVISNVNILLFQCIYAARIWCNLCNNLHVKCQTSKTFTGGDVDRDFKSEASVAEEVLDKCHMQQTTVQFSDVP